MTFAARINRQSQNVGHQSPNAISQKNGEFECTAAKTYKLTQFVCLLEPFTDTVMICIENLIQF
jgi:hypothetical protein